MNKDIVERGDIGFVDPRENSVYAEKKYVEVNEAVKTILNASPTRVWDALQVLAEMKGADVTPTIHGHWIHKFQYANHDHCYICSVCGKSERVPYKGYEKNFPYCHCGAKMEEKVTADEN